MDADRDARVAIADDDAAMRMALRLLIDAQPGMHVCGEAGDGPALEALVATERPDLLVADLTMPGLDPGTSLLALMRAHPAMRLVVLSGLEIEDAMRETGSLPGACYVQKGRDMANMIETIRSLATRSTRV